jgi:hypothetical protein
MRDTSDAAFLDLRGLSRYSSLGVSTLRGYLKLRKDPLPHYVIRGKILIRRDEFDRWLQRFRRDGSQTAHDVDRLLEGIM